VANGVVYVTCDNNYLYALDAATGEILWSYYTSADYPQRVAPTIVDGRLFHAATFNFKLYAFALPYALGVYFEPPTQTNPGGPGHVVAHQEMVRNHTAATDSFTLTLGNYNWDTNLSADRVGPLDDGDAVTVTVYVTVPAGVDWYSTDTVVVTATSVASPTVYSNTGVLTTQAYLPPMISVSPHALTCTQSVHQVTTRPLTISNGDGVTLTFQIPTIFPPWLSFAPSSGEVSSESSVVITVTFDALTLTEGIHTTTAYLYSNDPMVTVTVLPVSMSLTPEPITDLVASNDSPTELGDPTTLSATVAAGSSVTYMWAFGDGAASTGELVTHTYPATGTYTAIVTASNSISMLTATTVVTVTDVPIAGLHATSDSPTALGTPTTLTATVEAGSNIFYVWAFGDGNTGTGEVITYTYPATGTYTAIVTASNSVSTVVDVTTVTVNSPTYAIYLPLVLRW
jgi:hypothetical protein